MRGGCSDRSAGECKTPDETSSSRHADIYTSRLQHSHSHSRCSPSKRGSEREGESVRLGRVMRRRRSENGKKGSGNPETKRARVRATGVRVTGSSSRRTVACNGSKSCSDRRERGKPNRSYLAASVRASDVCCRLAPQRNERQHKEQGNPGDQSRVGSTAHTPSSALTSLLPYIRLRKSRHHPASLALTASLTSNSERERDKGKKK